MHLALLWEWEGEFRRHADGIEGMDTGECSTIDFSCYDMSFLCYYGSVRRSKGMREGQRWVW